MNFISKNIISFSRRFFDRLERCWTNKYYILYIIFWKNTQKIFQVFLENANAVKIKVFWRTVMRKSIFVTRLFRPSYFSIYLKFILHKNMRLSILNCPRLKFLQRKRLKMTMPHYWPPPSWSPLCTICLPQDIFHVKSYQKIKNGIIFLGL